MVKNINFTYKGMNRDVTKSKHPVEFYYGANNIRITNMDSQTAFAVTNEKGNTQEIVLPTVTIVPSTTTINYGNDSLPYTTSEIQSEINLGRLPLTTSNHKIIGHAMTRDGIILFSTSKGATKKGQMDCIWEVKNILNDEFNLELKYVRNLSFSILNPIQALFNYENERIQKVYWVDNLNQLRFANIRQSIDNDFLDNLIDISQDTINIVGAIKLSQPKLIGFGTGGDHTSGMVQYAYNLYRLNSSQTKISPLSELIPLDKGPGSGGGDVNEEVASIPIIKIEGLDTRYTHIKVYSIKWTSYNQTPEIGVIREQEIPSNNEITIYDDGQILETLSDAEFAFLGSDPIVPKNIEAKDNVLFPSNIKELNFDLDVDMRAYSFPINSTTSNVLNNVIPGGIGGIDAYPGITGELLPINSTTFNVPKKHDAVNPNYDVYRYIPDSNIEGGEGKYIRYYLTQENLSYPIDKKFFKDNELYRIGIQFYNELGQTSYPKWIADFKAPEGNLEGNYNTLKVELKPEFYIWLTQQNLPKEKKPIGYKIIRVDRKLQDRTIICQGPTTGMMARTFNNVTSSIWLDPQARKNESKKLTKFPMTFSRGFGNQYAPVFGTQHVKSLQNSGGGDQNTPTEVWESKPEGNKVVRTWQFTKIFQLYSPDILFNTGINFNDEMKLRVKGMAGETKRALWWKKIEFETDNELLDIKDNDIQDYFDLDGDDSGEIKKRGLFGPTVGDTEQEFHYFYNEYLDYEKNTKVEAAKTLEIFGTPEITEKGQGPTNYNNNGQMSYSNSMSQFTTDKGPANNDEDNQPIITMNSWGARCVTLVEKGNGGNDIEFSGKLSLEEIKNQKTNSTKDGLLMMEITVPQINLYLGSIYNGNTYAAKSLNSYIEIGDYKDINQATVIIRSPGDTFVQDFLFQRLVKTDTERGGDQIAQVGEAIKVKVETTVDLRNRHDASIRGWDTQFQASYDDFHKYNRVYSQIPNIITNTAKDFTFREVDYYDTRILATKTKVPAENIDSWTDILVNEQMDLDGKYGPINGMVNVNDDIFAVQDEALSIINVSPNVQIPSNDGTIIEIGTGTLLYNYAYITTKAGSLNKWSIIPGANSFYFFDMMNKSFFRAGKDGLKNLSDMLGFNAFFSEVPYDEAVKDNPLINSGFSGGYFTPNNEVYLTFRGSNPFTICYNEQTNSFTSFYSFTPAMYMSKGNKMVSLYNNKELWLHFNGEYNNFYGELYDSDITLLVNPPHQDNIFNNVMYRGEMYESGTDVPKETLTHIHAYNEYQDSGETPLVLHSNLQRKFRMWRANIPRNQNSIDRMRGNWIFLKLIYRPISNKQFVLHDTGVSYNGY